MPRPRSAFTLIELLVVVAIIAVLVGLLVPAVQKVRAAVLRTQCQNNLHNIGVALYAYHDVYKNFPRGMHRGYDNNYYWSWLANLLPFLEQENLYRTALNYAETNTDPWLSQPPNPALGVPQPMYRCPSDPRPEAETILYNPPATGVNGDIAFTMYLGNSGTHGGGPAFTGPDGTYDGVLYIDSHTRISDISDGTTNTLFVGERPPSADLYFGWWFAGAGYDWRGTGDVLLGARETLYTQQTQLNIVAPNGNPCAVTNVGLQPGSINNQCDQTHFWSPHTGGANFLFCDGSVHFLTYDANNVLPALATRAGGEAVALPD